MKRAAAVERTFGVMGNGDATMFGGSDSRRQCWGRGCGGGAKEFFLFLFCVVVWLCGVVLGVEEAWEAHGFDRCKQPPTAALVNEGFG